MLKIGQFEVYDILTGSFALDGGAMFGVIPKTIWSKTNPADELNRIDMVMRSLVLKSEDKVILIDTGIGDKWAEKYKEMYNIDLDTHNLTSSLKKLNVNDDDVTHVLLTHLHFDHTGGSTIHVNGEIKPRFKNAKYYCSIENWKWANNPSEKDQASYIKDNFLPLEANEQLIQVNNFEEIGIPEISSFNSDGHTIGMQLPLIKDEYQGIIYLADLVPTSSHLRYPFVMGYDLHPLKSIEEKKEILSKINENNYFVCFEHDPKISISKLTRDTKNNYIVSS